MDDRRDTLNWQLVEAVDGNDIERASHLLEKGASVNSRDCLVCPFIMRPIAILNEVHVMIGRDCSTEGVLE